MRRVIGELHVIQTPRKPLTRLTPGQSVTKKAALDRVPFRVLESELNNLYSKFH